MKVAFLGPYRDGTGYSQAAIDNIQCANDAGIDVVCRPVRMSRPNSNNNRFKNLEDKDLKNVDAVIQINLPHTFQRKEGVKNIGMFYWETNHFRSSMWAESCNNMDEIWVTNSQQQQACMNSGVTKPIKILEHPYDVNKTISDKKLDIPSLEGKCVFYTIGEMTKRKNFAALIRSYYSAFTKNENVALVIKTNVLGNDPQQTMSLMNKFVDDIKKSVHIHRDLKNYPPILVITEFLSEEQISQLHSSCDIFVSPSHGEAICLPAMDAMFHGNPVIVSNWGNFPELCYQQADKYWQPEKDTFAHPGEIDCGWLIDGHLTYCFGMVNTFTDIYTGTEKWFDVNLCDFVNKLQLAYEAYIRDDECIVGKRSAAKKAIQYFSYDKIGEDMKFFLEQ